MKNVLIDLGIDTSDQLRPPAAMQPPAKLVPKQDARPIDPLSVLYATTGPVQGGVYVPKAKGLMGWLGGKLMVAVLGNVIFLTAAHHIGLKRAISFACTVALAVVGRSEEAEATVNKTLDKAKDIAEAPPRPGLAARIIEPVKEATAKPIEAVRENAKKTVAKAEEKAEAIREEVAEQAGEVKEVIQGLKAEKPEEQQEEPQGLLSQAKDKISDAKAAVARGVVSVLPKPAPPLTEKQRDFIHRKQVEANRKFMRARVHNTLGQMGAQQMNAAAGLAAQAEAQNQQRINEAFRSQQNAVNQVNSQLRGHR